MFRDWFMTGESAAVINLIDDTTVTVISRTPCVPISYRSIKWTRTWDAVIYAFMKILSWTELENPCC